MKFYKLLLIAVLILAITAKRRSKEEWKSRSIYQVLTDRFDRGNGDKSSCDNLGKYCGGTYKGIKDNLDYIKGMGFDAIWVSPIVKNTEGGYHGYWAADLYKLNENFGSEQDFKDLITAMHEKDMWIMVDVVGNHVGPVGQDYHEIEQFQDASNYHDYCNINQEDFTGNQWRVENCRLADLPDLNTENDYVRDTMYTWIDWLVTTYDLDGLRIDTIPEVPQDFWHGFQEKAGCYAVGEVFDGRVDYIAGYQDPNGGGVDALLNYPLSITMKAVWARNDAGMYAIRDTLDYERTKFHDMDALAVFVDNHDNERFLHITPDHKKFQASLIFSLFAQGIPIVYYGSEQNYGGGNDPANREPLWTNMDTTTDTYQMLAKANQARKDYKIWSEEHVERYITDDFYAFTRGQVLVALTKSYDTQTIEITYHDYADGTQLCNIFNTSDCVTVNDKKFTVVLESAETKVYTPTNSGYSQATE